MSGSPARIAAPFSRRNCRLVTTPLQAVQAFTADATTTAGAQSSGGGTASSWFGGNAQVQLVQFNDAKALSTFLFDKASAGSGITILATGTNVQAVAQGAAGASAGRKLRATTVSGSGGGGSALGFDATVSVYNFNSAKAFQTWFSQFAKSTSTTAVVSTGIVAEAGASGMAAASTTP